MVAQATARERRNSLLQSVLPCMVATLQLVVDNDKSILSADPYAILDQDSFVLLILIWGVE